MGRITVIGVVLIVVVDAAVVSAIVRTEDPRVVVVILGRRPELHNTTACFPLTISVHANCRQSFFNKKPFSLLTVIIQILT